MKHLHTLCLAIAAAALILFSFASCNKSVDDPTPVGDGKLKLHFGPVDLDQRDVRAPIATAAENQVATVDVVFFAGQNKKYITPNSGGAAVGYFHFEATGLNDWVNKSPATQTVYIGAKASDVNGTTAVTLLNLPASVRARLAKDATDEIKTMDELRKAVSQTLSTVEELTTPLLMTGEQNVTFANPNTQDNQIDVNVKRAVSRLDVILYYNWDKLVPNVQRGLYTYKDFPAKTFVGANAAITDRVDGAKTQIADLTAIAAPLTAADPVPTSQLVTVYINEYDLTPAASATTTAPFILLELPAKLGEGNPIAGLYPPPAGGDFGNDIVKSYYKVILPRKLDRNCRYLLHAHVVGPGSPSADNAVVLQFNLTVLPWTGVEVPGYTHNAFIDETP